MGMIERAVMIKHDSPAVIAEIEEKQNQELEYVEGSSAKFQFPISPTHTNMENIKEDEATTCASTLGTTTANNTYIWTRTNSVASDCTGYEWIQLLLLHIDPADAAMYLRRFKAHRVTDERLSSLQAGDLKELIPPIGIRNEFQKLVAVKLRMDDEFCE